MRVHQITETEHDADTGQDFSEEKRELELFIMNDQDLYRQMFMPIIMNIVRKMKRGVYDHKLAPRLWQYLVDQGAKKYVMQHGGTVRNTFPKRAREELASDLADEQMEMIKAGEYSIATGYDPKKGE
tara:strand:+ start:1242 stop:1622 length:381 start_codon:yes stop_codon:yes gene_type:complete